MIPNATSLADLPPRAPFARAASNACFARA
jgi:hypothetical protein